MKCKKCGHIIPSGTLYCKNCGEEVYIVPEYNPLDDMLAAQIKNSINNEKQDTDFLNHTLTDTRYQTKPQRRPVDEKEARRRQAERRREAKRKKRKKLLIVMSVIFVFFIGLIIALYQTSYTGVVKKGNKALASQEYGRAEELFVKAIKKNPGKAAAYDGLSKVYIAKKDLVKAEDVFLNAIAEHSSSVELYNTCIQFYLNTDQVMQIPVLLDTANTKVTKALEEYIVEQPTFSLDAKKVYDDVQQLEIEAGKNTIYYTVNGSSPSPSSSKYTEPIQLDEGENIVRAISVNKDGIPSAVKELTYTIELPIEDAPAVSPSTGQYETPMKIEVKVPEGYTAYYTMDGSDPTTASKKYTGPINMPKNETLFKAVLINDKGRSSGITTRNYILYLE